MSKSRNFLIFKRISIFIATLAVWFTSLNTITTALHLLYLLTIGMWMWTANLDFLYLSKIDPLTIIYHRKGYSVKGLYGISIIMSAIVISGSIISIKSDLDLLIYAFILFFWILPHRFYITERYSTLETLVSSFGVEITISEVILCDLMTSYSRVMMMTVLESLWMIRPGLKKVYKMNRGQQTLVDIFVPLLIAFPYLLRFRQCVIEYFTINNNRNIPFWNGVKYLSALPTIACGYYMGEYAVASKQPNFDPTQWSSTLVYNLWILTSLVNALGSLYWDLVMDWHLLPQFNYFKKKKEFGILRQRLQFPRYVYFTAMALNTVLRFTWILKCLTITLYRQEGLDAFLIGGEMFRRWVWVFLRMEREWFVINLPVIQTPPNEEEEYYLDGDVNEGLVDRL